MLQRTTPGRRAVTLCAAIAAASLGAPAMAEDIFGSVRASDGRPLAFAEIEACKDGDPDACESTVTDGRGRYTIMGLSLGAYIVSVKGERGNAEVDLRTSTRVDLRVN